jgi:hypothetical protein
MPAWLLHLDHNGSETVSSHTVCISRADIHHQRVDNKGVLEAQLEAAEELDGTTVDIQSARYDEGNETEYPYALNFTPPDTF